MVMGLSIRALRRQLSAAYWPIYLGGLQRGVRAFQLKLKSRCSTIYRTSLLCNVVVISFFSSSRLRPNLVLLPL